MHAGTLAGKRSWENLGPAACRASDPSGSGSRAATVMARSVQRAVPNDRKTRKTVSTRTPDSPFLL